MEMKETVVCEGGCIPRTPSDLPMAIKMEKMYTTKAYIGKISIPLINLYQLHFNSYKTLLDIYDRNREK